MLDNKVIELYLLINESHFADVGDEWYADGGVGSIAAGPIDEECLADEVVAWDGACAICFTVAQAVAAPETRVVA